MAVEPYAGASAVREVGRFEQNRYTMALYTTADKTEAYFALLSSDKNLTPHDIEWRRGFEYFRIQLGLVMPEGDISGVGSIMEQIIQERQLAAKFFFSRGIPARQGSPGRLEWLTDKHPSGTPQEDEQGRVNFYEIQNIINVAADQPLARIHRPGEGTPGVDVFGKVIEPPAPDVEKYRLGKGVRQDDENRLLIAGQDGSLSYSAGIISIEEVYYVNGDVDFSVGNVTFRGTVSVQGQVLDGFTVQAHRDLYINNIVNAATLEAGGNIIIKGGVTGKDKGRIRCDGKLQAKYLNSVQVEAKSDVEIAGEIVNTKLQTLGSLLIPKGKIFNSQIDANNDIICDSLGSPLGVRTTVNAGTDYVRRERLKVVDAELEKLTAVFDKIRVKIEPVLADPSKFSLLPDVKKEVIRKLAQEMKTIHQELQALKDERLTIFQSLSTNITRKVIVYRRVYAGVEIQIADCHKNVEREIVGPLEFFVDENTRLIAMRAVRLKK